MSYHANRFYARAPAQNMERKWKAAFGVAALNDALDFTPVGSTPIVGNALDLATNIALWPVLRTRRSLITAVEYVPGMDLLPVYTGTVYYAYQKKNQDGDDLTLDGGMKQIEIN